MSPPRLVLILESDPNAIAQMRRVLAGMSFRVFAASNEEELRDIVAPLIENHIPCADRRARSAPERQRHPHAGGDRRGSFPTRSKC